MSVERAAKTVNGWAMLVVGHRPVRGRDSPDRLLVRGGREERQRQHRSRCGGCWSPGASSSPRRSSSRPGSSPCSPTRRGCSSCSAPTRARAQTGFRWGNPFYSNGSARAQRRSRQGGRADRGRGQEGRRKQARTLGRYKVSLRARTLNGEQLKVNDKRGNPIEIAAVVGLARGGHRPGDVRRRRLRAVRRDAERVGPAPPGQPLRLRPRRGGTRSRCAATSTRSPRRSREELQERLAKAGVVVEEARLTHLAYAPEIAQAMLRRQQAEAVIAARQKIVARRRQHGRDGAAASSSEKNVVTSTTSARPRWSATCMVVLCGESEVHPVVNTGTLYQ